MSFAIGTTNPSGGSTKGSWPLWFRATPNVAEAWYDPVERGPVARLEDGHVAPWSELSDGFHVFLGLVGDIARRTFLLNESDGRKAAELIEGVVLIDEIDLHLHPIANVSFCTASARRSPSSSSS